MMKTIRLKNNECIGFILLSFAIINISQNNVLLSSSFTIPLQKRHSLSNDRLHRRYKTSSQHQSMNRGMIENHHHPLRFFRHEQSTKLYVGQQEELDEDITIDNDKHNNSIDTKSTSDKLNTINLKQIEFVKDNNGNDSIIQSTTLQEKLFLGIQPTPEILAIMAIYFVEGALGLARLAQTFYLKDTLHLGPAELSALTGLFTLPWTIKPLYGFLSDGLPLFGYRRRSYLILCGLIGAFSYTALGMNFFGFFDTVEAVGAVGVEVVNNANMMIQATIASFVISSGCIAFSDVVADGIVVQRTRDSDDPKVAGGLQSLCWGSAAIGGLISAYFSGSLLEVMGPLDVFKITAVLPLLVATIAFFISEEPIRNAPTGRDYTEETKLGFGVEMQPETSNTMSNLPISASLSKSSSSSSTTINTATPEGESREAVIVTNESTSSMGENQVSEQIKSLWNAIKEPAVWKPALFLFLWQSTPTSEGAFLYFMTNDLGFGPEFLGRVRVVTAVASLVGVWGYQKFLRSVPIKDILLWTSIASAPLGLINLLLISHANRSLGIPDGAFVFGDDVVLAILGEFAFLPTLVLAARICPPGVEAVLFATLMSIFNGASTVGTEVGALLTKMLGVTESNFDNLGLLTIICNVSSLLPLLFIGLLDGVGTKSEAEIEQEE